VIIKRKRRITRDFLSVLAIYNHLCTYGESVRKPLIWLGLVILIGTLYWSLFFLSGVDEATKNIEISYTYSNILNLPTILKSFEKDNDKLSFKEDYQFAYNGTSKRKEISITNSTTINELLIIKSLTRTLSNIISINEKFELGDIFIRISSLIVLGGLAISIRRKIERRFRH
jgi:hypothetical protein